MKQNRTWFPAALVGVALAASTSLGLAANISYTFDSDTQGFGAGNAATSVAWDGTHNRGTTGGCLKYTLAALSGLDGSNTVNATFDVPVDTSKYFGVEFDMLIDAASGTDGSGTYGQLQMADFDAAYSWHATWYDTVGGPGGRFSSWCHVSLPFQTPYGLKEHFQLLLQAASSSQYNGDVIVYIDNVLIQDGTPPNQVALYDFAWPDAITAANAWGATWSHDTTLKPDGALKIVKDYGTADTSWQDCGAEFKTFEKNSVDFSKFTYIDFDIYLDAPRGQYAYGNVQIQPWWSWAAMAQADLSEANIGKWTHFSFPLTSATEHGLVFHPGGGHLTNTFTYYIDNVTLWKPAAPPTMITVRREPTPTAQGVELTMNAKNNQWQRDALCVPATTPDYSWVTRTPISYSFTIANFPDAVKHSGFEAHLFIVNESTIPESGAWNETYGACDWNAADLVKLTVENNAAGGVIVRLNWKTEAPGSNPPDANRVINTNGTTAIGTWTLTFDTDTTGTVTGPGGFSESFTLPQAVADRFNPNTTALLSFLQFGMGQNDTANNNHNYNASGVFSAISMSGGLYAFNESFPGPGLTASGTLWRTSGSAVQWVPADIAWWVTWTTPDDGFGLQCKGNLAAPSWTDVGATATYSVGANRIGGVPASLLPIGDAAFFRLMKP